MTPQTNALAKFPQHAIFSATSRGVVSVGTHHGPREETMAARKKDVVQVRNPRTGHYVKIDREAGVILDHKKTSGAYKGVPIARKTAKRK